MDAAELGLTAVRGVQIAASLSAFGVAVFWSVVAPPVLQAAEDATRDRIDAGFRRLFRASLGVAVAAALVWLVAQAAFMAEAESMADAGAAIWPVLTATRFGHVLGARVLLLVLSALALGNGSNDRCKSLAAVTAGLALILHTCAAHAAAAESMDRVVLLGAESLHLLAAGAWLGSLAPLFIAVGALAPDQGARAARRFSPLGMLCVAILAGAALAQGWILIGGLPGLVGTDYGRVALVKLALLLVLLALAAANRFHYAPAIRGPAGADARRGLRRNVAVETAVGLLAVLAASLLADLPPALHQQPVWPFAWQLNFGVLDDPDFGPQAGERSLSLLMSVGPEHQSDAFRSPGDAVMGFGGLGLAGRHIEVGNLESIGRPAARTIRQRLELFVGIGKPGAAVRIGAVIDLSVEGPCQRHVRQPEDECRSETQQQISHFSLQCRCGTPVSGHETTAARATDTNQRRCVDLPHSSHGAGAPDGAARGLDTLAGGHPRCPRRWSPEPGRKRECRAADPSAKAAAAPATVGG